MISAFVATAMGTSMGTVAAIAPIAVGVADAAELPLLLTIGTLVGGAMFGDNLSIISDTTIAATRTQGVEMRDKFRMNFRIALPAALLTMVWLYYQGIGQDTAAQVNAPGDYQLIRVLPYMAVLGLAVMGVNVLLVLFAGILLAGAIGLGLQPDYSLAQLSKDIYAGYTGMQEILVLSLLIGGLGAMMKSGGGLAWLASAIDRLGSRGERSPCTGELGIGAAVALTNACTANNTVAILLTGGLARILPTATTSIRAAAPACWIFSPARCRACYPTAPRCCWPHPWPACRRWSWRAVFTTAGCWAPPRWHPSL
ncbi:Na+/H+ antiporter NhaC family protein [Microbulbifer taiwanensis]|uniref:Na+/H+ antiporter NhaC family protein n=1 Tax=Microbulbifer taiwanensis TaxID=986746 RepID=UPI00360AC907